ncbi:hypothetical protein N7510_002445 [Penicillium lagena]|uniref:uncharacterized protein n=1 Tax=Penicillium lagena TaxID=94218 RepID=UPI00253F78C7|nr:uncharacterized protein N7510_002445 [Penicillium lagena]KAJ5626136.1 hypothetical protein N7510_002445 [Penicillium lagena]
MHREHYVIKNQPNSTLIWQDYGSESTHSTYYMTCLIKCLETQLEDLTSADYPPVAPDAPVHITRAARSSS